ncbi:P-loop NTPase fold protein [uncultured Cohaesibacter sp.]|uniref:KAP family P-loop NTPase fold protein n=1 Tax=uncultured Cohaesibacter sp. TaxID=1002546 RepID=UPI0029C621C2|nr:P-loop NTPase fold protein [uncultured Cohaesibacter sp.]
MDDRLGYSEIGHTFTNLIKSIDTSKVISIEAGFGRGKTFFRERWAKHLRQSGEVVVEIDVQQSDHSGDPVVTVLGALVEALPKRDKGKGQEAFESAKKLGAIGFRTAAKVVFRSGAEELIDAVTDKSIDSLGDFNALDAFLKNVGDEMSKTAGQLIASQMAAERVRKQELPNQLAALHDALAKDANSGRVIILIDELDRCHPDYAIAFLEAMKIVFYRSSFIFCLMVNADYLENLASHRFGKPKNDERYLDKFVDIRLMLDASEEAYKNAVTELASTLPLAIPYGDGKEFSIEDAAALAGELAVITKLSMRKTKRVLQKVEIALRCYSGQPLDASLLVFLAFKEVANDRVNENHFQRSKLTPDIGVTAMKDFEDARYSPNPRETSNLRNYFKLMREQFPELIGLPLERYKTQRGVPSDEFVRVYESLAPKYLPVHQSVLGAVAKVLASEEEM